jgi:DNA-binding transcriptional ArsR family regulator
VPTDALTALADPTRRRVFELIAERPSSVGQLADLLPVSRPAVSQHLKVLRIAGLAREERMGTRHVFSVDPSGIEQLRAYFDSFWQRSLRAYKTALEQSSSSRSPNDKEVP